MAFDPDAYISTVSAKPPFDPDEYIKKAAPTAFNPDAYISSSKDFWETNPQKVTPNIGNDPLKLISEPDAGNFKPDFVPADPAWIASRGTINLQPLIDEVRTYSNPLQKVPEGVPDAGPGQAGQPVINFPKAQGDDVLSGIERGLSNVATGFTTPVNLALMASVGGAPALLQKAAAVGFGAQMVHALPEQVSEAINETTAAGKSEKGTEAVASAVLAILATKHGTGRESKPEGRPTGLTQDEADHATTQNQLRALIPESVPLTKDAQAIAPEVLDGLHLAREKLTNQLRRSSPGESDQIQSDIDNVDEQLLRADRVAVQQSAERVAQRGQSPPPATEEAPPVEPGGPQANTGRSSLFSQALKEAGLSPETIADAPSPQEPVPEPTTEPPPDNGASVGPGAASAEEQLGKNGINSIKNAIVDQKRAEAGLPERVPVLRRTFGTIWDRAMAEIDRNPNAGDALVDELKKKSRPLTDQEDAILTHEQMDRQQEYDEAVDGMNKADTDAERVKAETRLSLARDSLHDIYEAGSKAGTENARGLNARRLMVKDDFTLANMEYDKIAANGGKKAWDALPKEVQDAKLDEVKKAHDRISELEKQIEASENSHRDELAKHYFDQLIKDTKKDVKESVKQGKSFTDFTASQADKARERIAARRREGRLNSLPVNELVDHAIIGADYIAKGAKTLVDFSKKMIADFGESIKPFLSDIFDKAKEFHDSNEKFFKEGPKAKEKTAETPQEIVSKAKAAPEGEPLSHKTVYDLARAHINAGVEGFENVMKAVHGDLELLHKGLTEREVRDAFSEYGKVKHPSKEADKMKLAEYRRIGQLQSAIDDALKGESPKKSGLQRTKPTLDVREKMAELREAMAKAGIETKSADEQLASRNEARATALKNHIEALDKQLKTGEKSTKVASVQESAQVEQLRAERDAMKEELHRIEDETNPPKSPEQKRLDAYKKSLQKQIDDLKARQASGNYAPRPKSQTVLDEEAVKLRTQRDAERQNVRAALEKDRLANRTTATKMADAAVQWSRIVKLASAKVYPKLIQAAAYRAIFEPASRVLGQPLRLINKDVYEKAYPESGASVKATAKYISTGLNSWGKAWEKFRTGKTNIDVSSGVYERDAEMINFVGNSHGMIKEPLRQAAFEASQQLRIEQAIKAGLDVNDPIVQTSIRSAAAESANRQVFTGDNPFTRYLIKIPISILKRSRTPGLPMLGRTMEFLMPIVNVPTNIAIHTARLNPLVGFSEFAIRMANASRRGELENGAAKLSSADAELLSRVFKTAALGTVLSAYAWTHPQYFGGTFDEKGRGRGGLKPNEIKIFGVTVPGWMNHVGELAHLNTVASSRRVWDRYVRQEGKVDAGAEALAFAMMAPVKTFPFIDTWLRLFSGQKTPGQVAGETLRDAVVPGVVSQGAALTDKRERSPKTFTDELKMPIPKVRESVPAKR